jgi:hypothetical protein
MELIKLGRLKYIHLSLPASRLRLKKYKFLHINKLPTWLIQAGGKSLILRVTNIMLFVIRKNFGHSKGMNV